MYERVDKSKESKIKAVAQKKNSGKRGFRFVDNRAGAIKQRKVHLPSSTDSIQRAIDVYLVEDNDHRKALRAEGDVSMFSGGSSASGTDGWINVDSYRSSCHIYKNKSKKTETHYATSDDFQNKFTQPQRGHLLGKQNGGNGSDSENLMAQDGGSNAGRYKDFEEEVKSDLNDADVGSWAVYSTYLENKGVDRIEIGNILNQTLSEADSIHSQ